jgi:hypothetical protein
MGKSAWASWPAEVARAFETEVANAFEPYGFSPLVTPMKIGMLREIGEGAQLWLEPRRRRPSAGGTLMPCSSFARVAAELGATI